MPSRLPDAQRRTTLSGGEVIVRWQSGSRNKDTVWESGSGNKLNRESMNQYPGDSSSRSLRARRTQPALPGITSPTTPIMMQARLSQRTDLPQPTIKKRPVRRAQWRLLLLGLLLALLYLALYPLFASVALNHAYARPLLMDAFPWLSHFSWTAWTPVARGLNGIALFNSGTAYANLLLVFLAIAFGILLIAARVGSRVARERISPGEMRLLFCIILLLAALFSLIFLFAPAVISQDAFLYALYGRMVTVYHVNPYVTVPGTLPANLLHNLVPQSVGPASYGPLWIDTTLAVVISARDSVANILIDFRLLALAAHLANALLIWHILARLRPEARIAGTLLYAWNPVVLLLGIAEMHYDLVVILFILLAAFFYQRKAFLLGWVCLLLATLMNALVLLLLLLFMRALWKESRAMPGGRRSLWWAALLGISAVIVVLAYSPYWPGWGLAGVEKQIRSAFVPDMTLNSLDAAVMHLRVWSTGSPAAIAWVASPLSWSIIATVVIAILLLLGLWLVENLELALLFGSWIYLAALVLSPLYQPWFILLPLTLAICNASTRTTLLALLLAAGALLSYYFWLWPQPWVSQALINIGLPLLIWGWTLFFTSTWRMTHAQNSEQVPAVKPSPRFSRPPWLSRPSLPPARRR